MSEPRQFGASLTEHGVTFRLWAPAAGSANLVLDRKVPMPKSDGWFVLDVDDVTAGARYAFEMNDEITIPDPASHFQPEDVHGRGEVLDHTFAWQCRQWRGLPWREAVFSKFMSAPSPRKEHILLQFISSITLSELESPRSN